MPKSRINSDQEYDQKTWIISILNTTDILIGHSALVVEGLETDPTSIYPRAFLGQYDISTVDDGKDEGTCAGSSFLNNTGFITKIKCFENQTYQLCLLLDDTEPEKGKFYIRKKENFRGIFLEYRVLSPMGLTENGQITEEDFKHERQQLQDFKHIIQDPFSIDKLKPFLSKLLVAPSKKAHTHLENKRNYEEEKFPAKSYPVSNLKAKEMIRSIYADELRCVKGNENLEIQKRNQLRIPEEKEALHLDEKGTVIELPRFQKFGKDHPLVKAFGNPEAGNNCTGWCLGKLLIAGVDPGHTKPKPKVAAGQCFIL